MHQTAKAGHRRRDHLSAHCHHRRRSVAQVKNHRLAATLALNSKRTTSAYNALYTPQSLTPANKGPAGVALSGVFHGDTRRSVIPAPFQNQGGAPYAQRHDVVHRSTVHCQDVQQKTPCGMRFSCPHSPREQKASGLYETRGKQRQSRFAPGDHQSRVTHLCSHCVSKATPACNCYRIGLVFVETLGPATFRRLLTEKRVRKETKRYACQGSNRYPAPLTACKGSASPEFSMHFLRRR